MTVSSKCPVHPINRARVRFGHCIRTQVTCSKTAVTCDGRSVLRTIRKTPPPFDSTVKEVVVITTSTTVVIIILKVRHQCCTVAAEVVNTNSVANTNLVAAITINSIIWTWFWTKNRHRRCHRRRHHRRPYSRQLLTTITTCYSCNTITTKNWVRVAVD